MIRKLSVALLAVGLLLALFLWVRSRARPVIPLPARLPEELVYVRSSDDVLSAGARFSPAKSSGRPLAVIWVHGWGANFYLPSYTGIARELAARGFSTLSVNTRMHDVGNVEKYDLVGKRVRGGGYWGITSQDGRDIAAWIDLAARLGFPRVVLVGHSAGWASVAHYTAESQDRRVAGLVLASGMIGVASPNDPELVAKARKLVAAGAGEDLLRLPNRAFPSFISAGTYLDMEDTPPEYRDFFGLRAPPSPPVARLKCPILAFFGTTGDVGGENQLNLLRSAVQRLPGAAPKVTTALIRNAGHEYTGEEAQVAETISHWAETELPQ